MLLVILRTDGFFIVCDAEEREVRPAGGEPDVSRSLFLFSSMRREGEMIGKAGMGFCRIDLAMAVIENLIAEFVSDAARHICIQSSCSSEHHPCSQTRRREPAASPLCGKGVL